MALIPPFFFDCVVALGIGNSEEETIWIASGFFYGHYSADEETGRRYWVYLVTNRHVLEGLSKVWLRCNPRTEEPAQEFELDLVDGSGIPIWFANPNEKIDIAVSPINMQHLIDQGMQVAIFGSDRHVANIEKMNELGISEGDFAYVLGFPMGIVGEKRNVVIARSGTIARIRDTLTRNSPEFLVDAFIFPGNSGGPVVSKPEAISIEGTKSQNAAYLIGVVHSYVIYEDKAISLQTKKARVIFEENSGLAVVHPIDFVHETIMIHLDKEKTKN